MIEIKTIEISGMASVLQALRLPFGLECRSECNWNGTINEDYQTPMFQTESNCFINEKDLALLSTLVKRGDSHAKCLRGLIVYAEIEAPIYWWTEMETHRFGHERLASASTMHIDARGLKDEELVEFKNEMPMGKMLKKIDFFSYQALRNIYKLRHDHRLPHWQIFCDWVDFLPFSKQLITIGL